MASLKKLESGPVFVIVADNEATAFIFAALKLAEVNTRQPIFSRMTKDLRTLKTALTLGERPYGMMTYILADDFQQTEADQVICEVADKIRAGTRLHMDL